MLRTARSHEAAGRTKRWVRAGGEAAVYYSGSRAGSLVAGQMSSALIETLSFLSDDGSGFEFEPIRERPAMDGYFSFGPGAGTGFTPMR